MKKVLVAMSGGVDSSVAAALLKQQGYFVAGAYMKNFSQESWSGVIESECPWQKDLADVGAVSGKLGIEYLVFNFEREYQQKVIEYFFSEYAAGRTPNPDVICNKEIKFGLFLEKALSMGFDYIATGHYARVRSVSLRARAKQSQRDRHGLRPRDDINYELLKGLDPKKDQSYFLYILTQEQLKHCLFPIGEYRKAKVRELAREFGLPNAEKKDSQGLCFVGHINLREFLKQRIPERVGEVVDHSGRIIGHHPGAWYYTIGQRHGLGIGGGTPYYVAKKDVISNVLTVTTSEYHRLACPVGARSDSFGVYDTTAFVNNIHWIGEAPILPLHCKAKIRYQQKDQDCAITTIPRESAYRSASFRVAFRQGQFAIAPGQAIIMYNGDKVLGGGTIEAKMT